MRRLQEKKRKWKGIDVMERENQGLHFVLVLGEKRIENLNGESEWLSAKGRR
jgi:hypothetical protein